MEVLNAAGIAPLSLPKNSASIGKRPEPKKFFPFPLRPSKLSSFDFVSLSSILGAASSASALSYEEALSQTAGFSNDFDLRGIVDGFLKFGSQNPLILAGGAAVVVVPLIALQILGSSQAWGVETAKSAYGKLGEDADAQLLDIREGKELREAGSPDVRGLQKKAVAITYRGEDIPGFLKKLALKFKDPGNTTLFILDKFDGNSKLVAELVTDNGFKAAFAIKDGAEGPRGWINSALPWSSPKKKFSLDFDELRDTIRSSLGETSDNLPVTFGLAAAAGLGLFAFTEIEALLQLVGSAAIIQLITKKLLFAEDRKVTLQQVDELLNTKVAPKELVDEIKMIGKALLPEPSISQPSQPAPALVTPEVSPSAAPELNVASIAQIKANTNEDTVPELTPAVNSIPRAELEEKIVAGEPTFLSPYPYYADFKPPSSPSPSQP